jgi:[ribosomal protein S5]-alanine N-acetyltransferase
MPQPALTTTRLTLRPATTADLDDLHRLWDDPHVRRFLFDDQPVSEQLATAVLEDCLAHSDKGYGLWLIQPQEASVVAGCVGLIPTAVAAQFEPRLSGLLEPLAALQPMYWHRGYATEALAALRDYAFTQLRVRELGAVNDLPNTASGRMLLRLGFSVLSQVTGPKYEMQTYYLCATA